MRGAKLLPVIAIAAIPCHALDLSGRINPAASMPVTLHGISLPYEGSTVSDSGGRFHFGKLRAGNYTLTVNSGNRGAAVRTIDLSPGTADAKGRLNLLVHIEDRQLESEKGRGTSAVVTATMLSVPESASKEYNAAQACLSRKTPDPACASDHLQRAVGIAPQFAAAWNQLGTMAYQARDYAAAEGYFRRAMEAEPEAFEPLVNLGGVLLNLGRAQEALELNRRAAERRPNDALANSQLGTTYYLLNNPDLAEKYLQAALAIDPSHFSGPQLPLAQIYLKRGDRSAATAQWRDFLARHPDSPQAAAIRAQLTAWQ